MSFKLKDLNKFLVKEDIVDDEEPMADVGAEMEKFADAPDSEVSDEEGGIPPEASEEIEGGFEMESDDVPGRYVITLDSKNVCCVMITCNGKPTDMATLEKPSECIAEISDVVDPEKTKMYKEKLEGMGFIVKDAIVSENLPESQSLINKSNKLLEE